MLLDGSFLNFLDNDVGDVFNFKITLVTSLNSNCTRNSIIDLIDAVHLYELNDVALEVLLTSLTGCATILLELPVEHLLVVFELVVAN